MAEATLRAGFVAEDSVGGTFVATVSATMRDVVRHTAVKGVYEPFVLPSAFEGGANLFRWGGSAFHQIRRRGRAGECALRRKLSLH